MNLPKLQNPQLYQGLYVLDHGHQVAVGYTAEEIELLQSADECLGAQIYYIHHATVEGQLSLKGIAKIDSARKETLCFIRNEVSATKLDFQQLKQLVMLNPPLMYPVLVLLPTESSRGVVRGTSRI